MSSYFDTMGTCLRDEWALIRLVRTQYRLVSPQTNPGGHLQGLRETRRTNLGIL